MRGKRDRRLIVAILAATALAVAGAFTWSAWRSGGDATDPAVPGPLGAIGPVALSPDAGPHAVTRARYDLGSLVLRTSGFDSSIELAGVVHSPTNLVRGPFPLVLFMHGYHFPCYDGLETAFEWPCPDGFDPLPNDAGYDYLASRLASWGFVVVSVSANGANVRGYYESDDTGMRERGELFAAHLDLWDKWNTGDGGPFGGKFIDKIDMSRIGTMGHSRGGEGAIWHAVLDRESTRPYGVDGVMAIAPSDLTGQTLTGVPLAVVLPTCDGDLRDLQGAHYVDRARYPEGGNDAPLHTVTMVGANHKFFNRVWTPGSGYPATFDDTVNNCPSPLTQGRQRRTAAAYIVSFFRRYVGGDRSLDPVWTSGVPAPSQGPTTVLVSYLAPGTPTHRRDLDTFASRLDLGRTVGGGRVVTRGSAQISWCAGGARSPCVPSDGPTDVHGRWLGRGVVTWDETGGSVDFEIANGSRDVSAFTSVQFRAAMIDGRVGHATADAGLAVTLVDGAGHRARIEALEIDRHPLATATGRVLIMQQVQFPLSMFSGTDLRNVHHVQLRFSPTRPGSLLLSDLAFTTGGARIRR